MFEGFDDRRIPLATGVTVRARIAGDGPPLLLLHGYPQTRACWHLWRPRLAPPLHRRGGRPARLRRQPEPAGGPDHAGYSKRAMAATWSRSCACSATTASPWRATTAAAAWRTGMALDHPARRRAGRRPRHRAHAHALRQLGPGLRHRLLPLVLPDPARRAAGDDDRARPRVVPARDPAALVGARRPLAEEAIAEYARCFCDPAVIHASCEDYRAAATIDLAHDAADPGADGVPAAGSVGRARRHAPPLRRAGDLAGQGRGGERPRAPLRPLPPRGGPGGDSPSSPLPRRPLTFGPRHGFRCMRCAWIVHALYVEHPAVNPWREEQIPAALPQRGFAPFTP